MDPVLLAARRRLAICAQHLGLRADVGEEPWIEHGGLTRIALACERSRQLVSAWWQGREALGSRPMPGEEEWTGALAGSGLPRGRPAKSA